MIRFSRMHRGQWSLIGVLAAVAIMIALAAYFIPKIARTQSEADEARTPKEAALGTGCAEYLKQINMAVQLYKSDHDDQPPKTFEELKPYGVSESIVNTPGCAFTMDPATGNVTEASRGKIITGGSPQVGTPSDPVGAPGGVRIPSAPSSISTDDSDTQ